MMWQQRRLRRLVWALGLWASASVLLIPAHVVAQSAPDTVCGVVLDAQTDEPLAAVTVSWQAAQIGTITNLDGQFCLPQPTAQQGGKLLFLLPGFDTLLVPVSPSGAYRMAPDALGNVQLVVRPGFDYAQYVMQQVVDSAQRWNIFAHPPLRYSAFDRVRVVPRWPGGDTLQPGEVPNWVAEIDTGLTGWVRRADLFLVESEVLTRLDENNRQKVTIRANRAAGWTGDALPVSAQDLQDPQIYHETLSLLSDAYLNPISEWGLKRYYYEVISRTVREADTLYRIGFMPKGPGYNALEGDLLVSSANWAVQSLRAEALKGERERQQNVLALTYALRPAGGPAEYWVPYQLAANWYPDSSKLAFPVATRLGTTQKVGLQVQVRSDLYNWVQGDASQGLNRGAVVRDIAPGADTSRLYLDSLRTLYSLNSRDTATYRLMDSLGTRYKLENRVRFARKLAFQQVELGPIDVDLGALVRFNDFEGIRPGLAAQTNERFSQHLTLGHYQGHGLRDEQAKYLSWLSIRPFKDQRFQLQAEGGRIGEEAGRLREWFKAPGFLYDADRLPIEARNLYVTRIVYRQYANLRLFVPVVPYVSVSPEIGIERLWVPNWAQTADQSFQRTYIYRTTGLTLRWAPEERVLLFANGNRLRIGSLWPEFRVGAKAHLLNGASRPFTEAFAMVQWVKAWPQRGKLTLQVGGYWQSDNTPWVRVHALPANGGNATIFQPEALNALPHNTAQANRLAISSMRFVVNNGRWPHPKWSPEPAINSGLAWGELADQSGTSAEGLGFAAPQTGYAEVGFGFVDLFYAPWYKKVPVLRQLGLAVYAGFSDDFEGVLSSPRWRVQLALGSSSSFGQ